MFQGIAIDHGYDALLRRNSLAVTGLDAPYSVAYGYDAASRLQSVTRGSHAAAYTYEPKAGNLVWKTQITNGGQPFMTTEKLHDNSCGSPASPPRSRRGTRL